MIVLGSEELKSLILSVVSVDEVDSVEGFGEI